MIYFEIRWGNLDDPEDFMVNLAFSIPVFWIFYILQTRELKRFYELLDAKRKEQ